MKKLILFFFIPLASADIAVHGFALFSNGIGRVTIGYLDAFSDFNISLIETRGLSNLVDLNNNISKIVNQRNQKKDYEINFFTDSFFADREMKIKLYEKINTKKLNFCISMCESDKIPNKWVKVINSIFDAVIVPDSYHVNNYINCGVKKPIFVLPLITYLDDFIKCYPEKKKKYKIIIGSLGAFSYNKNLDAVIESFSLAFKDNLIYELRIHSYWYSFHYERLKKKITDLGIESQVLLTCGPLTNKECVDFIKSLNCYITLSSGEGYSFTPREALAYGIPVVISNNTAHISLCNSNLVYSVNCPIIEKSLGEFVGEDTGSWFRVDVDEAAKKLIEACSEISNIDLINKRKFFANTFSKNNLISYYLQLIKPTFIELSDKNIICNNKILTTSKNLVSKYQKILGF